MSKLSDIIALYTNGEKTVDEVNELLKAEGANFHLDPNKNKLTAEEIADTVVSDDPAEVSGYGLLDMGIGCMDKVKIENGVLLNGAVGDYAVVNIGGKKFNVDGTKLIPYSSND